jgi:hypothetical protein
LAPGIVLTDSRKLAKGIQQLTLDALCVFSNPAAILISAAAAHHTGIVPVNDDAAGLARVEVQALSP